MKIRIFPVWFFSFTISLAVVGCATEDRSAKDLAGIQGEWSTVSCEIDGRSIPRDQLSQGRLQVQGNRWVYLNGPDKSEGTFQLDANTTPKGYQATGSNGDTWLGIYEFEGGTAKWCWAPPGKPRPERFEAPSDSGRTLIVNRRLEK
jgi:uncharacterized protein (TIGR03067 family)